jgi:glycosyltransferase involved in cell wall biosynthesis
MSVLTLDWRQRLRVEAVERVAQIMDALSIRRIDVRDPWPVLEPGLLRVPRPCPLLVSRVLSRLARLASIEPYQGWARSAEKSLSKSAAGEPDLILASAPPHSIFPLALRVAHSWKRPFVIDYRNLWTRNAFVSMRATPGRIAQEREVIARAAAAVVVSPTAAALLEESFGVGHKVHVLSNGYDTDVLCDVVPRRFDHFAIVYAGTFYAPRQSVTTLMRALALLHARNTIDRDWRFHYYGGSSQHVRDAARAAGLPSSRYEIHGWVLRAEALRAVAGAGLATIVNTSCEHASASERAAVPGKIFEAIGLRTQFLVLGPPGSDVESISERAGLGRFVPATDSERTAAAIAEVAAGVKVPPRTPETYDWDNIAPRFNDVLLNVLEGVL